MSDNVPGTGTPPEENSCTFTPFVHLGDLQGNELLRIMDDLIC